MCALDANHVAAAIMILHEFLDLSRYYVLSNFWFSTTQQFKHSSGENMSLGGRR
jgi:hypothetical protein